MNTPTRTHLRRSHGERGASLVVALVFISVFGLVLMALGNFATSSSATSGAFRDQRSTNYATDAALEAAVNRVAHDAGVGIDPVLSPSDVCNPATGKTVLAQPAAGDAPKIVVSCAVASGSGSGKPEELGEAPPYALLTLGDRRTSSHDGTVAATPGVRSTEPPPYNVPSSGDDCKNQTGGNQPQEFGIRQNKIVMPGGWLFGWIPTCGAANMPTNAPPNIEWGVRGDLFSNSGVQIDTNGAVPKIVSAPDETSGTLTARGGCVGSGLVCTDPGWDFGDGKGRDPGLVSPASYPLPSLAGLDVKSVPPASQCSNARKLVTFTPGIYTDAKALNDLFATSACKEATFWFSPDDQGTPNDPSDDTTGRYYFDFRNPTATSWQCGASSSVLDFVPDLTQNTTHQWCIGGRADDYGNQHVVGGTPYGWAPTADPVTSLLELIPGQAGAGPGTFFGWFPQPTAFVPGDSCPGPNNATTLTTCGKEIDGKTVNYEFASGRTGSSIWMSKASPKVPRGAYDDVDLQLAYAASNPTRMNAPTIQVNYQTVGFLGLKTTGTCGPYTLPQPNTTLTTLKLSDVNPGAYNNLKGCLNSGDKINSAVVQFNVNRPFYQGSPYATAKFDGVKILVKAKDAPSFPRQPSETDPGGDCDPDAAGVQFVFGGDSHAYVPNGGMELCAGPNASDPLNGQQIAVYGVPATPRLIPSSASGGTNPDFARLIAEVPLLQYATMAPGGAVTLAYPGFGTPSGYSVSSVAMRASFDAPAGTPAIASIRASGGGEYCNASFTNSIPHTTNQVETKTVDASCLMTSNRLASPFDVRWTAGNSGSPKLDGIEFIVTLTPDDANTTLRPQNGCVTASPDYWYGMGQGSSADCPVLRVSSKFKTPLGDIFGGVRQGRLSVKGSIYIPSAVLDIDDMDVWYPIASRGLVARHLRIRGFQYHAGSNEPVFSNYVNTDEATRQVVFLACEKDSGACTPTDPSLVGRAAVEFEAATGKPSIQAWTLGKL